MQALRQELRESTGKCRKGVIWLLHIRISVQHLQFSISSSWLAIVTGSVSFELDHVEDANRQQGLRSTAILSCVKWQRQNFLWLLCFHQMAMWLMSGFHCHWSKPDASFCAFWPAWATMMCWGMPCSSSLLHPVKNFLCDSQGTGNKKNKDVEEGLCPHSLPWK